MKYEKIAPPLVVAFHDFGQRGEPGLGPHLRALGIVPAEGRPRPPKTVVFIRCDEQVNLDHLGQHDIEVNQPRGAVRTAYLPLASLDQLSEDPAVHRILPTHYLRPLMDVARAKVHVPEFRHASGLSGRGVIIGIVDTGIDAKHPAFAGRILRIWDQTLPGIGVPEGRYGIELTEPILTTSQDTHGHGTHVAGIAGGADPSFTGVAAGAEYVIVKTDFMDAHIADGIRYLFRVAAELNRPAVVNLSLGGHADAHDGTDSLSQIIDAESGAGRIVCCAAGNEGNDNIHAQGRVAKTKTMRFQVPAGAVRAAALNGWYPGANALEISVRTPGRFVTPFQPPILSGEPIRTYTLPDAKISIVTPGPDPANGDIQFWVDIQGVTPGAPVASGIWQLRLRNVSGTQAKVNVWTLDDQGGMVFFTGKSVNDSMKIGSPGAAAEAITVASYTTRVEWTDIDGNVRQVGLALDDISDFSSEGPVRKGAQQKPDVATPGAMIVACLSSKSRPRRADMVNGNFRVMAGTSMATPFVAGLIALLLERDPGLDPNGVRAKLRSHSAIPGKPADSFDTKWGFGLIDTQGL